MATSNIEKLRLYRDKYNAEGMTDENSLAAALLLRPDVLSPVITHLAGREDKRFPLSFLTEGLGRVKSLNTLEYDYPVIGRLNKAVAVSDTNAGTTLGIGYSMFELTFSERWFAKQYVIESPSYRQARVMEDPIQVGDGWRYKLQLVSSSSEDYLPADDAVQGSQWVQFFAPVAPSGSRGNESRWVAPSKMRNQLTHIRKSYRYEGNSQNMVTIFEFTVNGRKTSLWQDFEEYQYNLQWLEEVESHLWYALYNRDADNKINLFDENNKAIPIGSGALEQIPNYDTYSVLTASKLKSTVRSVLYGATDSQATNVVLYTGTGGLEEFDNAMKDELATKAYIKLSDNKFVTGSGNALVLGGFFTTYKHIDGHTVTVRHLPLLDHGPRALNSPKHPVTGLPMESYRMIFLDQSMYDGEPNIYMVAQKGRELLRWAVSGATVPRGFGNSSQLLRASDVDAGSVHYLKTCGICIRRATNCMHLECIRS